MPIRKMKRMGDAIAENRFRLDHTKCVGAVEIRHDEIITYGTYYPAYGNYDGAYPYAITLPFKAV